MSKKYVIEIKPEYEDTTKGIMVLGARDSNLYVDALAVENLEELNSDYINEHFGQLQDDAYQRGLDDGRNETWEAAKKIFGSNTDGGYCMEQIREILGKRSLFCATDVIRQCTINEVIEKLKAYEEKQKAEDDIKVGDEVVWADSKCVVIFINRDIETSLIKDYDLLADDGSVAENISSDRFRKTGKHYDIDKILEEMKRED